MKLDDLKSGVSSSVPSVDSLKSGVSSSIPSMDSLKSGVSSSIPSVDSLKSGVSSSIPSVDSLKSGVSSALPSMDGLKSGASSALSSAKGALGGALGGIGGLGGGASALPFSDLLALDATPFTQNARLLKLQLCENGELSDRLPAQEAQGEEALSESYKIDITCQSPETGLELKHIIGLPAQISILTANAGGLDIGEKEEEIVRCGVITHVESLGADGGFARYKLRIEPPLALLRHSTTSRVFQDITVPDIVKTILDEHIAANPAFAKTFAHRFELSGEHPQRSYCLQYRETDFDFITRLLAEEGIAYRFEHTAGQNDEDSDGEEEGDGENIGENTETTGLITPLVTLVAFDDPYNLPQAAQGEIRFHREGATESEDSLTSWTNQRKIGPGTVALTSFDYKPAATGANQRSTNTDQAGASEIETGLEDFDAQTLYYASADGGLDRYAHLRQQAHDRKKKTFHAQGNVRELKAGEWFQLTEHPDYDPGFPEDAQFTVTRLRFTAANNMPGDTQKRTEKDSPERPYTIEIEAQRKNLPLVPEYAHSPNSKPTAPGKQTAIVVGPAEEEVYTDEYGRIKIQFHWQRQKEHPETGAAFNENSSCWVRIAYPSAGDAWGHQFIPRIGQEVTIGFLEGDIDRPLVTGVVYNGRHVPPAFSGAGHLPANKALSGIKTKEHFGSQYGELLFDDTQAEVRTKLSSEHGKTQLNQGFLTHPRTDGKAEPRGDGFELRTDKHGALRAAEGLLISTEAKSLAQGKQLDREEAQAQLDSGRQTAANLSKTASGQKADPVELGPETLDEEGQPQAKENIGHLDHMVEAARAWELGTNTGQESAADGGSGQNSGSASGQPGKQAILLASGHAGLGLTTPREMTLVAEKNLDTISQRDTQHTSARRWIHNVGKKISIFVHGVPGKISLKLTTAKGDANIWAQSGDVEIVGNNDLRIHANKGKVEIFAGEEALFNCGGAYIRIKGGGIDFHAPGKIEFKAANYVWSGPARQKLETKKFGEPKQCGGENAAEPYTPLLAMMPPVAVASGASANELPAETEELGETNETEELSETDESDEESDTDADREAALEAAKASGKTMNCKAPYTLADFEKAKQKVAQASAPKLSGLPASISGVIGTVSGIAGIVGGIAGTVAMVAKLTGNSDLAGQAGMVALGGIAIGAVGGIAKWGMGKIFGTPPAALTDAASGAAGAAGAATDAVSNAAGQASDAAKNAASSAADAAKNATGGPGQWT